MCNFTHCVGDILRVNLHFLCREIIMLTVHLHSLCKVTCNFTLIAQEDMLPVILYSL